ncbi:zinc finger HIT domain-containing protein 3 [Ctenocephalides felis]|uniref:zinc finger HIT domain-containing protein 3 n=1 Tax=Ctenocephalides felis TaxID=7515 RepID=UPI000E6E2015|nr:zinc finger HIT domain-containing protein 3 [Ctenocephalides felis]
MVDSVSYKNNICVVCECETDRYKCTTCKAKYCSLTCYKKHKEFPCVPEKEVNDSSGHDNKSKAIDDYLFPTEDTVPRHTLKLLDSDKTIKSLLTNHHLRNLLVSIKNSEKPAKAISDAMLIPLFVEFSDACLKVVEPEPIEGVDAE